MQEHQKYRCLVEEAELDQECEGEKSFSVVDESSSSSSSRASKKPSKKDKKTKKEKGNKNKKEKNHKPPKEPSIISCTL